MPEFNLEDYLEEIVQEVEKRQQETGDSSFKPQNHKELIHQVVGEKLGKPVLPSVQSDDETDEDKVETEEDIGEKSYEKPELKSSVDELINITFEKDLDTAVGKVKTENNPALLDAFHDALVDKLYDHLVQSGRLKQLQ
ncbi:MAG: hypothetical protein A3H51_01225 [Candidatus Spechtbacteria bacterium RIFCSPLOWO2_02_FULL_38_8]|uniref:Uncharacterized protein n=1 Tax=Candidatus Spechtbacteria bacterium RIFCSPLOWO2_02_FULL_38_8 TaxID=1802164 RepID=A0A1G2HG81_9BACT|nr:MAG: hypothetical protein A3H51_01225 [Candidatus Spechtbacteria bacterium RIFCSPLOWO2_02_FULL_38_8]